MSKSAHFPDTIGAVSALTTQVSVLCPIVIIPAPPLSPPPRPQCFNHPHQLPLELH